MDEALRAAREGGGPAVVVCFARDAPAGDARRSLDRSAQLLAEGASEAAPGADGPADGGAAASAGLPRQCVHYFRHFCVDYAGMGRLPDGLRYKPGTAEAVFPPTYTRAGAAADGDRGDASDGVAEDAAAPYVLPYWPSAPTVPESRAGDDDTGGDGHNGGVNRARKRGGCFNCGEEHEVVDCPHPRDAARIRRARQEQQRYHEVTSDSEAADGDYLAYWSGLRAAKRWPDKQPGKLSSALCAALGAEPGAPPLFLGRMRRFGYPPGFLAVDVAVLRAEREGRDAVEAEAAAAQPTLRFWDDGKQEASAAEAADAGAEQQAGRKHKYVAARVVSSYRAVHAALGRLRRARRDGGAEADAADTVAADLMPVHIPGLNVAAESAEASDAWPEPLAASTLLSRTLQHLEAVGGPHMLDSASSGGDVPSAAPSAAGGDSERRAVKRTRAEAEEDGYA